MLPMIIQSIPKIAVGRGVLKNPKLYTTLLLMNVNEGCQNEKSNLLRKP